MLVIDQNHCEGPVLNALALASLLFACLLAGLLATQGGME